MGKKKKKNRSSNVTQNWDNYMWGYHVPYNLSTVKSKEIHKIAEQIFGQTGYIEQSTLIEQ